MKKNKLPKSSAQMYSGFICTFCGKPMMRDMKTKKLIHKCIKKEDKKIKKELR